MSFLLTKLLPAFLYPAGLTCLLLVLVVLLRRRPRLVAAIAGLALAVLFLASNRWVSFALMRSLEWRYLPQGELPAADAIVVLGGGTLADEAPRPLPEVNEAGDRLIYGAWLYRQGKAPIVVLSGGNMPWVTSSAGTPADDMAKLLAFMDVPPEAMRLQGRSRNTYEDALYCAEILRQEGAHSVLLVTSASHMPRSLVLFEAQGLSVTPAPADFSVSREDWQRLSSTPLGGQLLYLLPNSVYLDLTTRALHEYYGLLAYRLLGWTD